MVQIIQDFIPKGRKNRPGYALSPKYLTVHDTANPGTGANAKSHAQYLKGSSAAAIPASWHFTVDDKVIVQHLPLTENGWHAGDGTNGPGNRQSIGIEICENKDGNRVKAEENTAWLCAKLIKEVGSLKAFPECIKMHFDWSGKNCPHIIRARKGGWDGFKQLVKAYLSPPPSSNPVRVVAGSFLTWEAAEVQANALKKAGFGTFFAGFSYQGKVYIRIVCGTLTDVRNADQLTQDL